METEVMLLDCPAYLDKHGEVRCGLPAEVQDRYAAESTDGPLECVKIRCPRGHGFNGTIESLTWHKCPAAIAAEHERGRQPARDTRTAPPGGS